MVKCNKSVILGSLKCALTRMKDADGFSVYITRFDKPLFLKDYKCSLDCSIDELVSYLFDFSIAGYDVWKVHSSKRNSTGEVDIILMKNKQGTTNIDSEIMDACKEFLTHAHFGREET